MYYKIQNKTDLATVCWLCGLVAWCALASTAQAQYIDSSSIVYDIEKPSDRIEMTANSSRILNLEQRIPRAQVNNQEILELTALSPNQIQLFAKKPGVTQVNIWGEDDEIRSIDIIVYGDVRELAMILQAQFPDASLQVRALSNSVVISGFVDKPGHVTRIIEMAQDYYPKVVNLIEVGGVQQVLLHIRVMEVSRTGLRRMSTDFNLATSSGFLMTSASGLINAAAATTANIGSGAAAAAGTAGLNASDTVRFGILGDNRAFFGLIDALRRRDLVKILAEPTLVTVSGRPAFFNEGGEFPILVPQALGTVSIEYKKFGTQVDFVPIVLGNGNIRLEVRPRVSEIDPTRSIVVNGTTVPGLRVREADTGVEMKAGQTLAMAGLIQTRVESENSGIPYLADLPYVGTPFRKVQETVQEIELLILVTPELVDALDPHQVPPCGPGQEATIPSDGELYWRGYLEVPVCSEDGSSAKYQAGGAEAIQGHPHHNSSWSGENPNAIPSEMIMPGTPLPSTNGAALHGLPPTTSDRSWSTGIPNIQRKASTPSRKPASKATESDEPPGLIGPVGYDS